MNFNYICKTAGLTSFSLSSTGLPTNTIMRILWFFPCLCFSASFRKQNQSHTNLNSNNSYSNVIHPFHFNDSRKPTCATLIPVQKLMFPQGWTAWSLDSILAVSGVSVVSTSQLLNKRHNTMVVL